MKYIYRLFSVTALCVAGCLISCNDILEPTPKSTWDLDAFYQNDTQIELALSGIYNNFANENLYGTTMIHFDSGTDECYYNRRYNDNWPVGLNKLTTSTSQIKDFWVQLYTCIDHCNIFEAKVANSDAFDEATIKKYLGEERFLRALAYFNLVEWFGPVPMPITYTKDTNDNNLAPLSIEEVYAQIILDLQFGLEEDNLPSLKSPDYTVGRVSREAAHGLLARVYMHMAGHPLMDTSKYQLAMNECEALMNNGYNDLIESSEQVQKTDEDGHLVVDDLGHPVMVTEYSGYRTLFLNYIQNNFDTKESIFEINYKYLRDKGLYTDGPYGCINGVSFSYGSAYSTGYPSSYAFVNASPLLYNTYAQNDKRRSWNIAEFTYDKDGDVRRVISAMATNFNPAKYRRWEPTDMADIDIPLTSEQKANGEIEPYTVLEDNSILSKNFSCVNFPVIRFADILLMYAEASNEVNGAPTTEGIAALNRVRQRANLEAIETVSPEKVASHDAFLSEIQDERMRELCFEGLRRQDLIRWGIYGERLNVLANQIKGDSNFSESDAQSNAYLRTSDNFDATKNLSLPYPDQEVKLNNLLEQKAEWK